MPDVTTLWRWLTCAVHQGVARLKGTGRPYDLFCYWLPARQEMMHPGGATMEEIRARNQRGAAAPFATLEKDNGAPPPGDALPSPVAQPAATAPVPAPEASANR
jgi:hypothetical protein